MSHFVRGSKNGTQVYLLDEIYERAVKMHLERSYCMRFLKPPARFDRINGKVEVFEVDPETGAMTVMEDFAFRLEDSGYPDRPPDGILSLCPNVRFRNGEALSQAVGRQGEQADGNV